MFKNRDDAGEQLARALSHLAAAHPIVLALPRGGVPVGYAIARALNAPLDLVLVRKIGAPSQPELALAAVVDGAKPEIVFNEEIMEALCVSEAFVRKAAGRELAEIERRRESYLKGVPRQDLAGRTVIVVDDGLATGATMRAALKAVRRAKPARLVLAVPVAQPDTLWHLRTEADERVCLETPLHLHAISLFYHQFPQLTDDEVRSLLNKARALPVGLKHAV